MRKSQRVNNTDRAALVALAVAGATFIVFLVLTLAHPGPRWEDQPGWDCHTQGNHVCGAKEAQ